MKRSYPGAEKCADEVLADWEITAPPVNPFEIAKKCGIKVKVDTSGENPGFSGALIKSGDRFGIVCFSNNNRGFLNFTLAHELGHYHLPGHPDLLFANGRTQHLSRAGFVSSDEHETEADHFAAALLMPKRFVKQVLAKAEPGLASVRRMADDLGTSLTASAIRYAKLSPDPVAVVVSEGDKIHYCFCSVSLRDLPGEIWIRKGSLLPPGCNTLRLGHENTREVDGDTLLSDWFDGAPEAEVYEQAVHLGSYGRVLTVLSSDDSIELEEPMEERMAKYFTNGRAGS